MGGDHFGAEKLGCTPESDGDDLLGAAEPLQTLGHGLHGLAATRTAMEQRAGRCDGVYCRGDGPAPNGQGGEDLMVDLTQTERFPHPTE